MSFTPVIQVSQARHKLGRPLLIHATPQVYKLWCIFTRIRGRDTAGLSAARHDIRFHLRQGKALPKGVRLAVKFYNEHNRWPRGRNEPGGYVITQARSGQGYQRYLSYFDKVDPTWRQPKPPPALQRAIDFFYEHGRWPKTSEPGGKTMCDVRVGCYVDWHYYLDNIDPDFRISPRALRRERRLGR